MYLLLCLAIVYLVYQQFFNYKIFSQNFVCGSTGTDIFVSNDIYKGKVAHIWILKPRASRNAVRIVVVVDNLIIDEQTNN